MDSDEGAPPAKNKNTRGKAAVVKEEINSINNNNNDDDEDDDDDDVQIIIPQRDSDLGPIKSAPSKAVTTSSSSSSSSARPGAGGKQIQKGNKPYPSSARTSRKNISDDEVENDDEDDNDGNDNWSGRQKSREVRAY